MVGVELTRYRRDLADPFGSSIERCRRCGAPSVVVNTAEGITVCADCGTALVETLPPRADHRKPNRAPTGPFLPDDDLVELTTVGAFEAEVVADRLRGAGIPAAVFGVGTAGLLSTLQHVEGSRVMIRRSDIDAAETVMADLFGADDGAEQ